MNDAASFDTPLTSAEAGLKRSTQKTEPQTPSDGAKVEDGSIANVVRIIPGLAVKYPCSPDGKVPRCSGSKGPQRQNWPERCERALVRYLTAQGCLSIAPGVARGEAREIERPRKKSPAKPYVRRRASVAA